MSLDDEWGRTVEATGEYARPEKLEGHLIIVFPLGYIEHMQTRFTVAGKKSDAICCDIIDLDDVDEMGQPGKIYRASNLMQAQLIMSLRPFIGRKTIVRIGKGAAKNGMNAPWTANDAVPEPGAVERANAWIQAHPDFTKSPFAPRPQAAAPQAPTPQQPQWTPPAPSTYQPQPQYAGPSYGQPQGYGQQGQFNQAGSGQGFVQQGYGAPAQDQGYASPSQNGPGQFVQQGQYPPAAPVAGSPALGNHELSVLQQHRQIAAERERQIQAQFGDNPPF